MMLNRIVRGAGRTGALSLLLLGCNVDTLLDVPPGAERDQVLAAMAGHVLASGELVGEYQQVHPPLK